ncbi:ABC transporter permease [Herpetosiphon llansteffanensis]|uniref:ABC transporter permease n=1 Tax=Herpetosiphon llansteffanensis TaxID=2094568 RepID=UPI0013E0D206|nr:ABC-2 family transporter protein [Herpetosiphon llansteffanensis]
MDKLYYRLRIYRSMVSINIKEVLAYNFWFWSQIGAHVLLTIAYISFWKALYSERDSIAGLDMQQTLTYIILARIVMPLVQWGYTQEFGYWIREGTISSELLRPVDFQERIYIGHLTRTFISLVQQLVVVGSLALFVFKISLPTDPLVWLSFLISLLLGCSILFCFDWIFGCIAFYSTEVWGLQVVRGSILLLFSGVLLPLTMLPTELQTIAKWLPFAQSVSVPVSILSGMTPLSNLGSIWLQQLAWLGVMFMLSRLMFNFSVRKITVQGG